MGIQQLPDYRDPFSKRVMTFGEIGCFLSHYNVWQNVSKSLHYCSHNSLKNKCLCLNDSQMLKNHENTALILEDDIRFEPYFVYHLRTLLQQAADVKLNWELMYEFILASLLIDKFLILYK